MIDRRYFIIESGQALERINHLLKLMDERMVEVKALLAKYVIEGFIENSRSHRIYGITNSTQLPFLSKYKRESFFVPSKKNETGKALQKDLDTLNKKYLEIEKIAEGFFTGDTWYIDGRAVHFPSWGTAPGKEDQYMVSVHHLAKVEPIPGMKEIRPSEYLRMLEDSTLDNRS